VVESVPAHLGQILLNSLGYTPTQLTGTAEHRAAFGDGNESSECERNLGICSLGEERRLDPWHSW